MILLLSEEQKPALSGENKWNATPLHCNLRIQYSLSMFRPGQFAPTLLEPSLFLQLYQQKISADCPGLLFFHSGFHRSLRLRSLSSHPCHHQSRWCSLSRNQESIGLENG